MLLQPDQNDLTPIRRLIAGGLAGKFYNDLKKFLRNKVLLV